MDIIHLLHLMSATGKMKVLSRKKNNKKQNKVIRSNKLETIFFTRTHIANITFLILLSTLVKSMKKMWMCLTKMSSINTEISHFQVSPFLLILLN